MPCIVLDRDGVINEESDNYVRSLAEWRPIPGSIEAIAKLSRAGFDVVVATNQSGLGRGLFDLDDLQAIHGQLCQRVEGQGGEVAGIFYCPHLPSENCSCRKPGAGLLRAAERELGVSLRGAVFIGDSLKDLQAAVAHGCRPALVKTGKGSGTLSALQSGKANFEHLDDLLVFENLAEAARDILEETSAPLSDT